MKEKYRSFYRNWQYVTKFSDFHCFLCVCVPKVQGFQLTIDKLKLIPTFSPLVYSSVNTFVLRSTGKNKPFCLELDKDIILFQPNSIHCTFRIWNDFSLWSLQLTNLFCLLSVIDFTVHRKHMKHNFYPISILPTSHLK